MGLRNIFKEQAEQHPPEEDYVELDFEEDLPKGHIVVQVEKITDFADTDRIIKKVREGKILLTRIKDLKSKDVTELKRAIEKIRKTCLAINGDIAGVGDEWLIVTPSSARVHRE